MSSNTSKNEKSPSEKKWKANKMKIAKLIHRMTLVLFLFMKRFKFLRRRDPLVMNKISSEKNWLYNLPA